MVRTGGERSLLIFTDMFGTVITKLHMQDDTTIKDGDTYVWKGATDFNQFDEKDIALRNADPEKTKFEFEPGVIVFTDGAKLEAGPSD